MKIDAVNGLNVYSAKKNTYFTGYTEALKFEAKSPVKTLKNAEGLFGELINEISMDAQITKTPFFATIKNIFEERGLKGLFGILGKSTDSNISVENLIKKVREENAVSVAKEKGSILDIVSYGSKPHDVHVGFSAGLRKNYIEFYTNKKGDIFVEQTSGNDYINTGFYSDTGTKKLEIESYAGGKPDKTYYNKDGSKPFFKNWLFGGTPVEPIY